MSAPPVLSERRVLRAEAAAWLARLRSDARSARDEAEFELWAGADPRRRQAFHDVTGVFEAAGAEPVRDWRRRRQAVAVSRRRMLQGTGVAAAIAGAGVFLFRPDATYATAVGEQRRVVLKDRTVVELDTDTRLTVRFEATRRTVRLEQGRAAFDVAADPERPFCVFASDRRVIADAALFEVARFDHEVVVLAERGAVAVSSPLVTPKRAYEPLRPGSRVRYGVRDAGVEAVDDLPAATAWRDGRLLFDGESLANAARQMNRYSAVPLVIADPELARRPIAGVYRTGDNRAFAESVALLLQARARIEPERIVLEGAV